MKRNKGFTLLEVLVSLAIIISIMFAFFKVYNSSIRVNTKNDRDIKALNLAQSELENLRSQIKNLKRSEEDKKIEINIGEKQIDIDSLNKTTVTYEKNYTDEDDMKERVYKINLTLEKSNVTNQIYMFNIDIDIKLKDEYFSKRKTELSTSILSNNINDEGQSSPTPPEEEPNFKDGVSFIRYQNSNLVRGYDISNLNDVRSFQTNNANIKKIKIFFKKKIEGNKEYIDIYVKINDIDNEIRVGDQQSFKDKNYYPCKSIRFDVNTWNGGNVNTILKDIKINGKLVKTEISSTESRYYDFNLDESGDFELEFDIVSNTESNSYFTVIFGK
ncbi:type IV pilus modification PilV family protein [Romboutsia weinsteinii]|uniref:type IV pilus modification PilV family protein n=1 Tax=Romboutsia weinsteinii TaxID=2020949 RepID=UPI0013148387|nr:type II secretion system protein [Romboutsia weinsteinii]